MWVVCRRSIFFGLVFQLGRVSSISVAPISHGAGAFRKCIGGVGDPDERHASERQALEDVRAVPEVARDVLGDDDVDPLVLDRLEQCSSPGRARRAP
jgi:hypothetical protein